MYIFIRGYKFIKRYILTNPLYVAAFVFWYPWQGFVLKIRSETDAELGTAIREGKSLIRLGDGEINLLLGLRNHYQDFNKDLKKHIWRIVTSYSSSSPYVLAVPFSIKFSNRELRRINRLYVWMPFKVMFWLYFNKAPAYTDAHAFYYDGYFERFVGPELKDKKIILITNAKIIAKWRHNPRLPWSNVEYVVTPEENVLSVYGDIRQKILQCLDKTDPLQTTLIFAMGPVGKELCFELSDRVQCLDLGRGAETIYSDESIQDVI